jgi:hypothetical protein
LTHNQQIKLIREAFDALPDMQDGFKDVPDYLYEMNLSSERQHRRYAPNGIKHGLSVRDAAKLFTVSHLLDGWEAPNKYSIDDLPHIRLECLYAQAYAKRFHKELEKWAEKYTEPFKEVDYAELQRA